MGWIKDLSDIASDIYDATRKTSEPDAPEPDAPEPDAPAEPSNIIPTVIGAVGGFIVADRIIIRRRKK